MPKMGCAAVEFRPALPSRLLTPPKHPPYDKFFAAFPSSLTRMTRFAKLLAIFLAVASLAFAGFAIATWFGGPDWEGLLRAEVFKEYKITRGGAPDFIWTAVRSSDDGQVASSKKLPEVLVKVMDDALKIQQEELAKLTEREPQLQARVEILKKAEEQDQEALAAYETDLRTQLKAIRDEEVKVGGQVITATAEAQKLENVIVSRREDILRLKQQVEELRADQFRLLEIQKQLNNLLIQVQGDAQRAELRKELLAQPEK